MKEKKRFRWGMMDFTKPFPKSYKYIRIAGLICLALGFGLAAKDTLVGSSGDGDAFVGFLILYGIFSQISVAWSWVVWKMGNARYRKHMAKQEAEEEQKRLFAQQHPHYEQEQFYRLCKDNGIADIDTPEAVARMLLLAKNKGISGSEKELTEAFKTGRKEIARMEKEAKVAQKKQEEAQLAQENLRYKDAAGQQKRILMCRDRAAQYREEEKSYRQQSRNTQDTIIRGTLGAMQKETDWATHGGIASGIAGPAAGVAVAADIQRKNAGVRAYNDNLRQLSARVAMEATKGSDTLAYHASQKAEKWEERAAAAENKLVQNLPEAQLMGLIAPEGSAYNSETGAIIVNVHIFPTKDMKIYETVPAVVDGSLKVQVLDGDEILGTTYVALPWNGSAESTMFKGVCIDPARKAKKYTVQVEPVRLWAMEK